MFKPFKKAFWILCEDITVCPSVTDTHSAIAKYCENNGYSYDFVGDREVVIGEIPHDIIRVRSAFYRGRYVIKCREK